MITIWRDCFPYLLLPIVHRDPLDESNPYALLEIMSPIAELINSIEDSVFPWSSSDVNVFLAFFFQSSISILYMRISIIRTKLLWWFSSSSRRVMVWFSASGITSFATRNILIKTFGVTAVNGIATKIFAFFFQSTIRFSGESLIIRIKLLWSLPSSSMMVWSTT